jgi:hypothetical protein
VEECLSTILPSSADPALAAKLLKVIEALRSGSDLDSAAKSAGLDHKTTTRFVESVKTYLEKQIRDASQKAKESNVKKSPGERASRSPGGKRQLRVVAISDGASRGNPGEAACAVIVTDANGDELLRRAQRLGVATNNVAEYHGVILALELARTLGASELLLKLGR